jgi:kinesin family protein 15
MALGRVTTELVKTQKNGGVGHVPYRDSKLTFLLQVCPGGSPGQLYERIGFTAAGR